MNDRPMIDDTHSSEASPSRWEREAERALVLHRRASALAWGTTALAAAALIARLVRPFAGSGEMLFAFGLLALVLWGRVRFGPLSRGGQLRRALEQWTRARTVDEAFAAAMRALAASLGTDAAVSAAEIRMRLVAAAHAAGARFSDEQLTALARAAHERLGVLTQLRRTRDTLEAQVTLLTNRLDAFHREAQVLQSGISSAKARVKQAELRAQAAEARAAVAEAAADRRTGAALDGATREIERLRAALACAEERARAVEHGRVAEVLQYPQGSLAPASTLGAPAQALRDEVAAAQSRAERGVVVESPIAASVISDAARWSTYGPPLHMTQELLELFEPSNAAPLVRAAVDAADAPRDNDVGDEVGPALDAGRGAHRAG